MHLADQHSKYISIIWPVWLNGWVFVYELSGCGFEFRCCHSSTFVLIENLNSQVVVKWNKNETIENLGKFIRYEINILQNCQWPQCLCHFQLKNWKKTYIPPPWVTLFFTKMPNLEKDLPSINTKRMMESHGYDLGHALREKCPNIELFLVRIFLYSNWIRKISVFSPNTGKYGPGITPYLDTFHAVVVSWFIWMLKEPRICYAVFREKRS